AYESLLLQTRLKKYVDSVGFLYKDGVLSRDYSYTVQLFNETFAESPSNALTDLSEYIVLLKNPREWYEGLLLLNQYFEAVEKEGLIEDWKANSSTILNKLERKRIFFSKGFSLNGDQGNDKFLSNITNNVNDRTGNDIFFGSLNDDRLYGGEGDDHLYGGLGDDRLYGGEGEDYLEGGVGQDILEGGQGSDTYVFSKGHGQDIIEDYSFNHFDSDIIRFVDVNIPEKLWFSRRDNNLLITNLDTADTLTVNNWYLSQNYQIERIELSDGRSLGSSQVEKLVSAMAEFDVEHSGDVLSVPQDEMRKYLNTLSVATYYS
ncbi:TPA: hypothetical protein QB217_000248, partial [Pasteurella multocida]|nr:hypothetical protein [Pasteurella multocida]